MKKGSFRESLALSKKEKPERLFARFLAYYRRKDSSRSFTTIPDALILQGSRALPILPKVLKFIHDAPVTKTDDESNCSMYWNEAAKIAASIGSPAAVPLAKMISEEEVSPGSEPPRFSRYDTITEAFRVLSVEGRPAVPILVTLLDSPSAPTRTEACRCLASVGPLASTALPRLEALCEDLDPKCQVAALDALVRVQADPARLTPLLTRLIEKGNGEVRDEAFTIIITLGKPFVALSDPLLALLARTDLDPRDPPDPAYLGGSSFYDFDAGKILLALDATGLRDTKQCEALFGLMKKAGTKINPEATSLTRGILLHSGSPGRPIIERCVAESWDADDATQMDVLIWALSMKPPPSEELLPRIFDRALEFNRRYFPPDSPLRRYVGDQSPKREPTPMERKNFELFSLASRVRSQPPGRYLDVTHCSAEAQLFAIQQGYKVDGAAIAAAAELMKPQLSNKDPAFREQSAEFLGGLGPNAIGVKPELLAMAERYHYTRDNPNTGSVKAAYNALALITGDTDHWIAEAEEHLLQPMLAEKPRDLQAIGGFVYDVVRDLHVVALPYLRRWIAGPDADLAKDALSVVPFLAGKDPTSDAIVLSIILENRAKFDFNHLGNFPLPITRVSPPEPAVVDIFFKYLQRFRDPATKVPYHDPAQPTPGSIYDERDIAVLDGIISALEGMGGKVAGKAIPILLAAYNDEPAGTCFYDGTRSVYDWQRSTRAYLLSKLYTFGVDPKPLAKKWLPKFISRLKDDQVFLWEMEELATYGKLAEPAVPEIIRRLRMKDYLELETLDALVKIAPEDERTKALQHLALFKKR